MISPLYYWPGIILLLILIRLILWSRKEGMPW